MTKRFPVKVSLSPGGCILGALVLLVLPWKLLLAAFFAAAIHECCHLLALLACGVPILRISIGAAGAAIRTPPFPPAQELLCALAGPVGSLLCLLAARNFPLLALCGIIQGLYNLLPIYPLDGGRVLRCAAQLFFPAHDETISSVIGGCTAALLVIGCFFLFLRTVDIFFLLLGLYFLFHTWVRRKIPCKDGGHWVQ